MSGSHRIQKFEDEDKFGPERKSIEVRPDIFSMLKDIPLFSSHSYDKDGKDQEEDKKEENQGKHDSQSNNQKKSQNDVRVVEHSIADDQIIPGEAPLISQEEV